METSILNQWFSGQEIKAICWTLIHSLWIGLVTALLCGIVIAATRKSAAVMRYRLLCSLLLLFVCAIGVTYYLEAGPTPPPPPPAHAAAVINIQHNIIISRASAPQHQTLLNSLQAFLNQNVSIIFLVWALFFVLKSLKMVSGLLYIQRIRNYKTSEVTEELKRRIELLSNQIGIGRAVRLVQSELVKVPVAVGWLKPMILLPVGIAFQLTPEQLDGILWHELAHIRRRDYLVNILQGIVETVFFFNPGLLWLSSLIRTEREACCDDMVLSRMNRKANYLEALLSFGYGEFSQARYAMSIGSGNQLRDRLKRMISQENKRLSVAEKSVLAIGLVVLSAFTTISKDNPVVKHLTIKFAEESGKVMTKTMAVTMHTLPAGQRVNDSKPGARLKDTIIVTDTAVRFTTVLFKNADSDPDNSEIRAMDDKGNKYHFMVAGGKITSMEINGEKVVENKLPDYTYMVRIIKNELAAKRRFRDIDGARMNQWKASHDSAGKSWRKYKDTLWSKDKAYGQLAKPKAPTFKKSADMIPWRPLPFQPLPMAAKFATMQSRVHDDSIGYAAQLKRVQNVINDLVHAKVVPNAEAVSWFGLTDTVLIVNGQKQSNELRERLADKYGISRGNGLFYGPVQMHGVGVFIDAADMAPRLQRPAMPKSPKAPGPRYHGKIGSGSADTLSLTNQQLIEKQQRFAAEQDEKRQQLIAEQQRFVEKENAKRAHIQQEQMHVEEQQQHFAAEQNEKRAQLQQQQQDFRTDYFKKMNQQRQTLLTQLQPAISGVITDLVSANVISDKSQLSSFILTNQTLMVNGKKQAEDIHEKLKSKYLDRSTYTGNGDGMDWNRFKNDPNFGLQFDTNGNEGIGIIGQ